MADQAGRPQTLSRIVALRIVIFAGLAIAVQAAVIFADYYFDDAQLAALMIEREADALSQGIRSDQGVLHYDVPSDMERYRRTDGDYVTRIRSPAGDIIYTNCDTSCTEHLLPQEINPPDLWSRMLQRGRPIAVAGGRSFDIQGGKVFVEIAIRDDQERVMWHVLGREFADHLAVPMSLMLLFVLGGTLLSIRMALRPVELAAREAEHIDPLDPGNRISIAGMPREISDLVAAVNRTLGRIHSLMASQRLFTTAVAHEIRTPLAMMKLEFGHIDHPRARKIEEDIDALARFVGQITALGHLESANRLAFHQIDLSVLCRKIVTDIAPWVYDRGHTISLVDSNAGAVIGHPSLLDDAIRNLIENAVNHTPPKTAIEVTAGPGRTVTVSDDAGLLVCDTAGEAGVSNADHFGIGLEIVRRIMAIHHGRLDASVKPARRTVMRLVFNSENGRD
jgi:signal transduction histidine kinase